MEGYEKKERDEIFSKSVRAGRRTYFFDVRATKGNDYYLTLTESKKRFNKDGTFFFEKHKIFLYREDFEKFLEGLDESLNFIKSNNPKPSQEPNSDTNTYNDESSFNKHDISNDKDQIENNADLNNFTQVEFDDLEDNK